MCIFVSVQEDIGSKKNPWGSLFKKFGLFNMAVEKYIHGKRDNAKHVGKRSNELAEQKAEHELQEALREIARQEALRRSEKLQTSDSNE